MTVALAHSSADSVAREAAVAASCMAYWFGDLPAPLSVRLLEPDDTAMLVDFRADIVARLTDPDFYRLAGESGDFVRDHLGAKGITAGLFDGAGALVAYGALGLPRLGDHNRGQELGLPADALPLVAHVTSAMVRPDWYQRGLHHRLLKWRLDLAGRLGRRHLLTTVSTRNHQSWGHMASYGLLGKKLIDVGSGLIRLLVHRDLLSQPQAAPGTDVHHIPVEQLVEQAALFADGYWLWRRVRNDAGIFAELRRPSAVTAGDG